MTFTYDNSLVGVETLIINLNILIYELIKTKGFIKLLACT